MARALILCPIVGTGTHDDPFRPKYSPYLIPELDRCAMTDLYRDACLARIRGPAARIAQVVAQSDVAYVSGEGDFADLIAATSANRVRTALDALGLPSHFVRATDTRGAVARKLLGLFALSQRTGKVTGQGIRHRLAPRGADLATTWGACPAALRAELEAIRDSFRWTQSHVDPMASASLAEVMEEFGAAFLRHGQLKDPRVSNSLPVNDTFSTGTALEGHTTDSGHSWGGDAASYTISGGTVSTETQGNHIASVDPSDSETDVKGEITGTLGAANSNNRVGVHVRYDNAGFNSADGYQVRMIGHDGSIAGFRIDAGTFNQILTGSTGLSTSTAYKLGLVCIGSTISIELDDTEEDSTTDATHDGSDTFIGMYQRATSSNVTQIQATVAGGPPTLVVSDGLHAHTAENVNLEGVFVMGRERKCTITISHADVDSDLSNFVVVLTEACLPSEMFDADGSFPAQFGGGDVRFTSDAAGNTPLACDVQTFVTDNNPANGKAIIYVRVPTVAGASDTEITVWYHSSAIEDRQPEANTTYGAQSVWQDARGAWLMQGSMARTPAEIVMVGGAHQADEVIPEGTGGDSDLHFRECGNVVWDPNTSQYLMVYTGYNTGNNTDEYIHGATSPDGKVWTKCTNKPLFNNRRSEDPYLVIDGTTYYIFCEDKEGTTSGNSTAIRCYSNTTFDADWDATGTDHGQVIQPASSGWDSWGRSSPAIIKIGSLWYCLYEGSDTNWTDAEIGVISSSSLTSGWPTTAGQQILRPADTNFPSQPPVTVPDDVWFDGAKYWMIYHADPGGDFYNAFASADSITQDPWVDHSDGTNQGIRGMGLTVAKPTDAHFVRFVNGGLGYVYSASTGNDGINFGYGLDEFGFADRVKDAKGVNHGTMGSSMVDADLFATGKIGRALNFDGAANDQVTIADAAALDITGEMTLEVLVEGDDDPEDINTNQIVVAKGDANYLIRWANASADAEKSFSYDYTSGFVQINDDSNLAASTFYQFVGRRNATTTYIDRDGVQRDTVGSQTPDANNDPLRIGAGGKTSAAGHFDGRIQSVIIWPTDRTVDYSKARWSNVDAPGTFASAGTPTGAGITLAVAEALHAHAADSPSLTQANVLAPQESLHAHAADSPALVQANTLAVAEALHGHSADSPALTQANVLAVAEALHAHLADNLALVQANVLAVAEAVHAHAADNVTLDIGVLLTVQEALHGHSADNLALAQAHVLAVAEALHAHLSDNVDLTQANILAVQEALHGHLADNVDILLGGALLAVQEALHGHLADNVDLLQASTLVVADALHATSSDGALLQLAGTVAPRSGVLSRGRSSTRRISRGGSRIQR